MHTDHHSTLSPSRLDLIMACPCFVSGPVGEAAEMGSAQHKYAEMLLRPSANEVVAISNMDASDRDNVEWYCEYVKANASGELKIEIQLELIDSNGRVITWGTMDALSTAELFDYKSDRMEREHFYQMAAYAIMAMQDQKIDHVTCHICYGRLRKVVKHSFTMDEAWSAMNAVLARFHNPSRIETPCEYCSWCSKILTCPAMQRHVDVVAAKYAPEESDQIACWNPGEVSDPATVGRMLTIARIVGPWCESVEKHAKLMLKTGKQVPGWSILERAGARQITDITKAFALCGLSEAAFLRCCSVKVGELEETYAAEKGMKKVAAKRELKELLAEVTETKKPYAILVRQKNEN